MKVLLIEDEDSSLRQTKSAIERIASSTEIVVARCRDEAFEAIQKDAFDLIVCDLKIPPTIDSADINESHGVAVHGRAREASPGTPLVFLTAFATPRNTKDHLSGGGLDVVFGIRDFRLVQLVEKDDVEGLDDYLTSLITAANNLDASCTVSPSDLDDAMFIRAVRVYANLTGHSRAFVRPNSGLSGASVGRVRLESDEQAPANVFMKVLHHMSATDESDRYGKFVANRLQPGYFAPALPPLRAGLRKKSALIYTLADDRASTLFDVLRETPDRAPQIVRKLQEALRPWTATTSSTTSNEELPLRDLRRLRISDEKLAASGVNMDEYGAVEHKAISIRKAIVHGDLHGENILIDSDERPMIVDYGDVGLGYPALDPVTLELSVVFHRDGPARSTSVGAGIRWELWSDPGACYGSSPLADFARACREWAYDIDSNQALGAAAYAHSLRQLKYPDTDPEIALAVSRASLDFL